MKAITSRDNPAFRELKQLAGDGRRQRRERRTLIDGPHLLAVALDHDCAIDLVVVGENAVMLPEISGLLARTGAVATVCLRDALFREISELASPVGILARIAIPEESAGLPSGDCVLLDGIQDAGNVGTLLRTAAAAGVSDVLLGSGCAGAWTPRVLRAGQGAHFGLRIREQADLHALLKDYTGQSVAAVAHAGRSLYETDFTQPTAWLFGSEGVGIAPELAGAASRRATIPLAAGNESLNVAAAAAICLFEMRRQRADRTM